MDGEYYLWIGFPRYSAEYGYKNQFGDKTKKMGKSDSPFKKKSILFELPYWCHNPLRHNLDAMHIEKNICDKILGTLLNIGGKSKDHINARLDLQDSGIRRPLDPVKCADGQHLEIRAAIFDMTNKEKDIFCYVLKNAKLPYGCASNVSRYVHVKEGKVVGYKSHDAHFILHYLLQFSVKKTLKPEVALPMIRFSAFLRDVEYHIGTKKNKDGKKFKLKDADWKGAHRYILFNSDNKEIENLIEEHRAFVDGLADPRPS
ncbi:hypothetical protein POM88_001735 [Heracleum sosnowskyi]|uniref:Uncharacterized protein n=1 Tax=Heracleum sosnowskyi TaxID=360622 RepID=A0AAD8JGR6_9APIA|nr:hypothetical protein POM88_001735 [Heracleum sosnowskyi]